MIDIETSVLAYSQVRFVPLQQHEALPLDPVPPWSFIYFALKYLVVPCIKVVLTFICIAHQDGSTALMYAAQAGNIDAVIFLVSRGSNTEQQRKVANR